MRTKDQFLNRHFSNSLPNPFAQKDKQCIHTKNIFSIIDLSPEDEQSIRLKKHKSDCNICANTFKTFESRCFESKIYIPKPQIDTDTKIIFNNEVHDLFKVLELNEKTILKKKITKKIKMLDNIGASFLQSLASKSMLKTYAFGIALFVILKKYFN